MSSISQEKIAAQALCAFIDASPTPYHAVANMVCELQAQGYQRLHEADAWQLQPGNKYFVTRNGSSLIAFRTGAGNFVADGVRMVGAHTDSPCLKIKPRPDVKRQGCQLLGVEVYGGMLFNPWFDRDLSLAGRVTHENEKGELISSLVNFARPIARIPSLAIHLDREANEGRTVNSQKHLPLVIGEEAADGTSFRALLQSELEKTLGHSVPAFYSWEIYVYDTQAAAIVGLNESYISSARLDNLLSCFAGMQALLQVADDSAPANLLICTDHEEVGSMSACGAQGPFLRDVLERMQPDSLQRQILINRSMMISADNAHAVHPNYWDRHEDNHGPKINAGPVIKINANQRYATNSENSAVLRQICARDSVPLQEFVTRTDLGCGSTIGPLTAANVGVSTLDIGCPQWAMHSIRETAGVQDLSYLVRALKAFFERPEAFRGGDQA